MLNSNPFGEGLVRFYHLSVGCNCSGLRADVVKVITCMLTRLLFGRRPPVSQLPEWTFVKECMSFLALGVDFYRVGSLVLSQNVSRPIPHIAGRAQGELVWFRMRTSLQRPGPAAANQPAAKAIGDRLA